MTNETSDHFNFKMTSVLECDLPFIFEASGSFTSIARSFQSVSPSSIRAITPRTFTCFTSPRFATWENLQWQDLGLGEQSVKVITDE